MVFGGISIAVAVLVLIFADSKVSSEVFASCILGAGIGLVGILVGVSCLVFSDSKRNGILGIVTNLIGIAGSAAILLLRMN